MEKAMNMYELEQQARGATAAEVYGYLIERYQLRRALEAADALLELVRPRCNTAGDLFLLPCTHRACVAFADYRDLRAKVK
jgi:hypothetical protein